MRSKRVRLLAAFGLTLLALATTASGSAKPKWTVGLVFDLTGRREPALDVVRGIELAQSILKSEGVEIDLVKIDSGNDAAGTRAAMTKLLQAPPDFIIAEIDSSKAIVASEMAEAAKRVMITPYATSPAITVGREFVFRGCFSDEFQASALASLARDDFKAKTAAIVYDAGQLYSSTLAETFAKRFQELGGKVVMQQPWLFSKSAPTAPLGKIYEMKPDLVFLPVYEGTASRMLNRVIEDAKTSITYLGGDGWGASGPFADLVFSKKQNLKAFWVSHYSGDRENRLIKKLTAAYQKSHGMNFNASTAIGYDSLRIAALALQAAGAPLDQAKLAKALRALPAMDGASGRVQFAGHNDPRKSLYVRKVGEKGMEMYKEIRP